MAMSLVKTSLVALLLASPILAQTSTDCSPLNSEW